MKKIAGMFLVGMLIMGLNVGVSFGQSLSNNVHEYRLKNGLTVLLYERHQTPIISCRIYINVGSANDASGQTGLAHMTEHMAFKGTPTLGTTDYAKEQVLLEKLDQLWQRLVTERDKGALADQNALAQLSAEFEQAQQEASQYVISEAYSRIIEENGGVDLNASTTRDATQYFVNLPANRLELWMRLEADRLAHSVPREFYQERQVILEERQMRTDASPVGMLVEQFLGAAFIAHPYGLPAIGWESDIHDLTPAQLRAFWDAYYSPQNMVIAIVGDLQPQATIRMAEQYFGQLPVRPSSPLLRTVEPPQPGERRVIVEAEANPYLVVGYHRPAIIHPDNPIFTVIATLLSNGRTARLYKTLVEEQQLAIQVEALAAFPGERYPTLFMLAGIPLGEHPLAELESALLTEIDRLKTEPVESRELQKVMNTIEATFIDSLASNRGLAEQLVTAQSIFGDWRALERQMDQIKTITAQDIMRVAQTYFTPQNRTVAWLVKKSEEQH